MRSSAKTTKNFLLKLEASSTFRPGSGGLPDFFRNAGVQLGHPPLNLPMEELIALFREYGMDLPNEP